MRGGRRRLPRRRDRPQDPPRPAVEGTSSRRSRDKGRFAEFLRGIEVSVALNPEAALLGRAPTTPRAALRPGRRSIVPRVDAAASAAPADRSTHDHAGTRAARRDPATTRPAGGAGGRTSATAPGPPSARTTAPTATPGTTSPTTSPAARPTAGARTASPASATATSSSSSPPPSGTAATRSSRSASSASPRPRGTTARTSRSITIYLDNTPTHSYMQCLYKYPQARVPLRAGSSRRTAARRRTSFEYELIDTGIFDEDRYFDIVVEYAKADARGPLRPDRGVQPRPRPGPAPHPAAPLVPQHLVVGARAGADARRSARARPAPTSSRLVTDDSARRRPDSRSPSPTASARGPSTPRPAAAAVHRQRDEHAARLRARATRAARRTSRTPSTATSIDGEDCTNPDRIGTKAAIHYVVRRGPAGRLGRPPLPPLRPRRPRRPARRGRRRRRPPPGRGRRVLRGHPARRRRPTTSGWSSARRSPACSGASSRTSSTSTSGSTATTPTGPPPGVAEARSATSTGGT